MAAGLCLGVATYGGVVHAAQQASSNQAAKPADQESTQPEVKEETQAKEQEDKEWITLFNGKNLDGWKASENADTFKVKDGELIVKGPRAHLFYTGEVEEGTFKDFELKCDVLTKPKSNSGIYFHTKYQDEGWPSKGYEVQLNNTHRDPKKTGGLYAIADVIDKSPAKDNEWFTMHITVKGKRIIIRVNDKVVTDYIEPDNPDRDPGYKERILSEGTFALQGHDPESEVRFRKIRVKPLK